MWEESQSFYKRQAENVEKAWLNEGGVPIQSVKGGMSVECGGKPIFIEKESKECCDELAVCP